MPKSGSQIIISEHSTHSYGDVCVMYVEQAGPGFLAALCYTAAGITGTVVANENGVKTGAAFSLATVINGFVEDPCFIGMNAAGSILVGRHNTQETARVVGEITRDGVFFGVLLAVPSALMLLLLPKPILTALHKDPEIISDIQRYFLSFAPSLILRLPMVAGTVVPWATLHAMTGLSIDLFYKGLLTSGLNFALGSLFRQDMLGLGLSPFIAAVITAPLVREVITRGAFKKYNVHASGSYEPQHLGQLSTLGAPFILEEMLLNVTRFIRAIIIGDVGGNMAVAAFGVAEQISWFAGVGHIKGAAQIIAANAYGQKNYELLLKASRVALLLGVFFPAISFALTPHACIRLFVPDNEELVETTSSILRLNLLLTAAINLSNIGTKLLRVQEDVNFPLWVNLLGEIGEGATLALLGFSKKLTIPSMYAISIVCKLAKAIVILMRNRLIRSRNETTSHVLSDETAPLFPDGKSSTRSTAKSGFFGSCWSGLCKLFRRRPSQQDYLELRENAPPSGSTAKMMPVMVGDARSLPAKKLQNTGSSQHGQFSKLYSPPVAAGEVSQGQAIVCGV
jgi:Na+-driven multidrug efflux pump